eukprot:6198644-Pleurochrysis_carterae.AAC.1
MYHMTACRATCKRTLRQLLPCRSKLLAVQLVQVGLQDVKQRTKVLGRKDGFAVGRDQVVDERVSVLARERERPQAEHDVHQHPLVRLDGEVTREDVDRLVVPARPVQMAREVVAQVRSAKSRYPCDSSRIRFSLLRTPFLRFMTCLTWLETERI